jgi:hypothetical protein
MDPVLLELFLLPRSRDNERVRRVAAKALKWLDPAVLVERDGSSSSDRKLASKYGIRHFPSLVINRRYMSVAPKTEEELLWILRKIGLTVKAGP